MVSLSDMVFGQTIQVEKETIDKYGRTVGTIFVNGLNANREQVKKGMAWVYKQYMRDQSLLADEETARQSKLGLWSESNPIPPWEFRHGGKKSNRTNLKKINTQQSVKIATVFNGSCGDKHYCKEMSSCDEAMFYINQCGLNRLDGDGDGIPCENLCGKK